AGVQHELVVQLIPLPHANNVLLARLDTEPLVVRVVDDVDLLGRHIDEPEDVALGAFRHRQHPRRAAGREGDRRPRIGQRQAARKFSPNRLSAAQSSGRASTTYSVSQSRRASWRRRFRMYVPMPKSCSLRASMPIRTELMILAGSRL